MTDKTQYTNEGRAPILIEAFNTFVPYKYDNSDSGQLPDLSGLRFVVMADPANNANVLVGNAADNITFPFTPGFAMVFEIDNLNQIFATISSGDYLHVLVFNES